MARLIPSHHAAHRLWIPNLRKGDDSPSATRSTAMFQAPAALMSGIQKPRMIIMEAMLASSLSKLISVVHSVFRILISC
jgi:hypothetical protein